MTQLVCLRVTAPIRAWRSAVRWLSTFHTTTNSLRAMATMAFLYPTRAARRSYCSRHWSSVSTTFQAGSTRPVRNSVRPCLVMLPLS